MNGKRTLYIRNVRFRCYTKPALCEERSILRVIGAVDAFVPKGELHNPNPSSFAFEPFERFLARQRALHPDAEIIDRRHEPVLDAKATEMIDTNGFL